MVLLVIFALISRGQAADGRAAAERSGALARQLADEASTRALAIESERQLVRGPGLAVLLARRALEFSDAPAAERALRNALDLSPVRGTLLSAGEQNCKINRDGMAFSPDSELLAQASCDGRVLVVSASNGAPLRSRSVADQRHSWRQVVERQVWRAGEPLEAGARNRQPRLADNRRLLLGVRIPEGETPEHGVLLMDTRSGRTLRTALPGLFAFDTLRLRPLTQAERSTFLASD